MAYTPYYPGGWQSGEEGGTPITPAALNNIENGIGSALYGTQKVLGGFATLAELSALLDAELANMGTSTAELIRCNATASVSPFVSTTYYMGLLYKNGTSTVYSHAILYAAGAHAPIDCQRDQTNGWVFNEVVLQPTGYTINANGGTLTLSLALYAQCRVTVIGYREASIGEFLLCRNSNISLVAKSLGTAPSNIAFSMDSSGVVTITNNDSISSARVKFEPFGGTVTLPQI